MQNISRVCNVPFIVDSEQVSISRYIFRLFREKGSGLVEVAFVCIVAFCAGVEIDIFVPSCYATFPPDCLAFEYKFSEGEELFLEGPASRGPWSVFLVYCPWMYNCFSTIGEFKYILMEVASH
jgi:hypothetical protein